MAAELVVTPITRVDVEVLDAFGSVMAKGELNIPHVPGVDEATPSLADEVRQRFSRKRVVLDVPGTDPRARYSIRFGEVR